MKEKKNEKIFRIWTKKLTTLPGPSGLLFEGHLKIGPVIKCQLKEDIQKRLKIL